MLTIERLKQVLKEYTVPSRFSHFSGEVTPPFIVYLLPSTENFMADNQVYYPIDSFVLELYSRVNILQEEKKLEEHLTNNNIPWEKASQSWLDDEKLVMSVYDIG